MEIRPKKLLGKTIFIEFSNWIEHKADCYWHFISLNEKEKFNVFPCGNNLSEYICKKNCLTRKNIIKRSEIRHGFHFFFTAASSLSVHSPSDKALPFSHSL